MDHTAGTLITQRRFSKYDKISTLSSGRNSGAIMNEAMDTFSLKKRRLIHDLNSTDVMQSLERKRLTFAKRSISQQALRMSDVPTVYNKTRLLNTHRQSSYSEFSRRYGRLFSDPDCLVPEVYCSPRLSHRRDSQMERINTHLSRDQRQLNRPISRKPSYPNSQPNTRTKSKVDVIGTDSPSPPGKRLVHSEQFRMNINQPYERTQTKVPFNKRSQSALSVIQILPRSTPTSPKVAARSPFIARKPEDLAKQKTIYSKALSAYPIMQKTSLSAPNVRETLNHGLKAAMSYKDFMAESKKKNVCMHTFKGDKGRPNRIKTKSLNMSSDQSLERPMLPVLENISDSGVREYLKQVRERRPGAYVLELLAHRMGEDESHGSEKEGCSSVEFHEQNGQHRRDKENTTRKQFEAYQYRSHPNIVVSLRQRSVSPHPVKRFSTRSQLSDLDQVRLKLRGRSFKRYET